EAARSNSFFSGNNFRSATSDGNNNYWGAGANSGINYFGNTAAAGNVSTTLTNTRVINIFNNTLYFSTASGANRGIYALGSPPPTGGPVTATNVINTGGASSNYGFAISPGPLTNGSFAYIADDSAVASGGGVQRWNFDGTTWTLAYTLTGGGTLGARGLA